jgi:hypothetical protein
MKYMNLRFAIEHRRVYGYELADALRLDPANFSRRLRGRTQFAPHQKARIAELLGFPADWLFAETVFPSSTVPRSYIALAPLGRVQNFKTGNAHTFFDTLDYSN